MSDKEKGIFHKYDVIKISNPEKAISCIVLEFDDPIARVGIRAWAAEMEKNGYLKAADQAIVTCNLMDIQQGIQT